MTTNLCIIVYIVAVLITLVTCFKSSLLVYNIISWEASTRHSFFLYFFIFFILVIMEATALTMVQGLSLTVYLTYATQAIRQLTRH